MHMVYNKLKEISNYSIFIKRTPKEIIYGIRDCRKRVYFIVYFPDSVENKD